MKKKVLAAAITVTFLLFMSSEHLALPLQSSGEDVFESGKESPASPAINITEALHPLSKAKAPGASKNSGASIKRPRIAEKKSKGQSRRDDKQTPTAALAARRLYILRREYARRTKRALKITSFRRSPAQQAHAIYNNIQRHSLTYVLFTYHHSRTINEILAPYRAHRRNPQLAQKQMTTIIQNQMARGIFVSRHLLGAAVDIRSKGPDGARLSVLRQVAHEVGARVSVEADHIHVGLA